MRRLDPERYGRHLRHGWPIVVNLFLVTAVTQVLDTALRFGVTPLDRFLPEHPADFLWHALLWTLVAITLLLYLTGHTTGAREMTFTILAVFTVALLLNVFQLAWPPPEQTHALGSALLFDGLLIWINNVLLFTIWYWGLDGGGYLRRVENDWAPRDFLFPPQGQRLHDYPDWQPHYVDYLFLAFTTATAFGPTDTQTLSRRAKFLQTCQSSVSLVVVTVIVARAIGNLSGG